MAYIITVLITVILDQVTKLMVLANFKLHESRPVIQNIFHFTYVTNRGGAFSLLSRYPIIFKILSITLVIVGLIFIGKILKTSLRLQVCLGLLMGGTIGNLIDRLRFNTVVDFLDFRIWPVFNVADIALVIGVCLLTIIVMMDKKDKIEAEESASPEPHREIEALNEQGTA